MWIQGIGTAVPPQPTSQQDTLQFVLSRFDVHDRTKQLYKKTLSNASIEKRHFSLSTLDQVLDQNHDRKNARFERSAVQLSTRALNVALSNANVSSSDLDYVIVTTCTGYLCPGLSAHLVESCNLRGDVRTADLVGMGCGAAMPALEQACNFLHANPGRTAAVVCTEICSAAMVSNDEVDIVISNTIFSDGSAALILSNKPSHVRIHEFQTLIVPEWRETLRFRTENGHLKNVLGKKVPEQSAIAMRTIAGRLLSARNLTPSDIEHWVLHAGGEKILDRLQKEFSLSEKALRSSRTVLRNYGNMSSPTVLFCLDEEIRTRAARDGKWGILGSFGAGFSAFGAILEWM